MISCSVLLFFLLLYSPSSSCLVILVILVILVALLLIALCLIPYCLYFLIPGALTYLLVSYHIYRLRYFECLRVYIVYISYTFVCLYIFYMLMCMHAWLYNCLLALIYASLYACLLVHHKRIMLLPYISEPWYIEVYRSHVICHTTCNMHTDNYIWCVLIYILYAQRYKLQEYQNVYLLFVICMWSSFIYVDKRSSYTSMISMEKQSYDLRR